eukprot:TRINITY_DN3347_c0_g1_i2.p1 TRINITY_DN3347_c0_g1~~TRINITY_DN3347_c0_g1_i2.p1  ORF type:complete len:496 (+),score=75.68 TRINITY_DN3347_c0_g1_i2:355-1842(+)
MATSPEEADAVSREKRTLDELAAAAMAFDPFAEVPNFFANAFDLDTENPRDFHEDALSQMLAQFDPSNNMDVDSDPLGLSSHLGPAAFAGSASTPTVPAALPTGRTAPTSAATLQDFWSSQTARRQQPTMLPASVAVVTPPTDPTGTYKVIDSVSLAALLDAERLGISPSIARPCFSPSGNMVICGTEDTRAEVLQRNQIFIGMMDEYGRLLRGSSGAVVEKHVSVTNFATDFAWLNEQDVVFGLDQQIGLMRVEITDNRPEITESVVFPAFHRDTIREIAVSPHSPELVLSGGMDSSVFVTNITKLCDDMQMAHAKSENAIYPCRDPVGSVAWSPTDASIASCTTDPGVLHIFDIRTEQRTPAQIYDTKKPELFSHTYCGVADIVLGFGDGSMYIYDFRMKQIREFQDSEMHAIGELRSAPMQHSRVAAFGRYAVTVWDLSPPKGVATMQVLYNHQRPAVPALEYKTTGCWKPNSNVLLTIDGYGQLAVLKVNV